MRKSIKALLGAAGLLLMVACGEAEKQGFEGSETFVKDYEQRSAQFSGTDYLKVLDGDLSKDRRQALQFLYAYMPLPDVVDYSGDSFRDLTRIAKINEHMWSELFLSNKEPLLRQMDLFLDQFVKLREYLVTEDKEKMEEMMRLSTRQRELFDTHQPPRRR